LSDAGPDAHVKYRAEMRRLQVLGEQNGQLLALGDLSEGELIAHQGAFKLHDGALARVAGEERGQ